MPVDLGHVAAGGVSPVPDDFVSESPDVDVRLIPARGGTGHGLHEHAVTDALGDFHRLELGISGLPGDMRRALVCGRCRGWAVGWSEGRNSLAPSVRRSFGLGVSHDGAPVRSIVISPEALSVGARLDEHHPPETNGRMAVCRRCGTKTDDPTGRRHVPDERQVDRSGKWLDAQARASRIESARYLRTKQPSFPEA